MEPLASQRLDRKIWMNSLARNTLLDLVSLLRIAIEGKHLFSFILWGPPGVGKTTIARMYAKSLEADFTSFQLFRPVKMTVRTICRDEIC
jgi:putative ATPase